MSTDLLDGFAFLRPEPCDATAAGMDLLAAVDKVRTSLADALSLLPRNTTATVDQVLAAVDKLDEAAVAARSAIAADGRTEYQLSLATGGERR